MRYKERWNKSLKTKSDFLGIPYGTACGRLKKNLMFSLISKLGLDTCFKCGEKIISSDEMTIDHKMVWLHVDTKLFWDIDNIAFSHAICNKTERRPQPRKAPDGMAWCSGCKLDKPLKDFGETNQKGVRSYCLLCRKEKEYPKTNNRNLKRRNLNN